MAEWIKQSTAVTKKMGPFLDETDAVSEEEGLAIAQADIRLSKNGGAFAESNNAAGAAHDENGYYGVPLDTTDTNTLGSLRVAIHEAGALPVWQDFMVVPTNVWDSMFGADKLQVDMTQCGGSAVGAGAVPNAAADAAGGLPVSDAGGLDLDTKLSNTNEVTAARMGALTDWINGGRLDLIIDAILADTNELQGDDVPGVIGALNNLSAANVNTEVVDVINTDTSGEPAQGAPPATASLRAKVDWIYKTFRNKKTQTATWWKLMADDAATVDSKASVSSDGETVVKGEIETGP